MTTDERLAAAVEQIRDRYCPPPERSWKKASVFVVKALAIVSSFAVSIRAVDWYLGLRKGEKMAERCEEVAHRLFFYEGDAEGASHFLKKAKDLDGGEVRYRLSLGYVKSMTAITDLFALSRPLTAEERARVDAALAEAMFLQEAAPNEPMSHVLAAQAYALLGARDEAVASVSRAVAMAPEVALVRVCACQVYYALGDFEAARRQVEESGRIHPRPPLTFFWKGYLALTVDRDVPAARAVFEELTRRAPRLALSHAALGEALLAEKNPDFKVAAQTFRKAMELDPGFYSAMLGLGEIAMRTDNLAVARLWYDRALRQDPNCIKALESRARLNGREGDWKAAVADWTAAIDLAPFRADLYRGRAEAYSRLNDSVHAATDRRLATVLDDEKISD